jgi:hypothetical protein
MSIDIEGNTTILDCNTTILDCNTTILDCMNIKKFLETISFHIENIENHLMIVSEIESVESNTITETETETETDDDSPINIKRNNYVIDSDSESDDDTITDNNSELQFDSESNNQEVVYNTSDYLSIIIKFFKQNNRLVIWKDLYNFVSTELKGQWNICPYSKKIISRKTFEGRLRSCIEEHSSDSRQHYFRNGLLQRDGWRKNLFSNPGLRRMNEESLWQPYSYCRGNRWIMEPGGARPDEQVLLNASRQYRVKGFRQGVPIINDERVYRNSYLNL